MMKRFLFLTILWLMQTLGASALDSGSVPPKFPIPWGNSAGGSFIRAIPVPSQIGIQNGAASLTDGFPPLTFTPVGAGGVPPFGQDWNGIIKQITQWSRWQGAGGPVFYDSGFSSSIGGYPKGAVLSSTATAGVLWISTVDNNTVDPDAGASANWINTPLAASQTQVGNYAVDIGTVNAIVVNLPISPSVLAGTPIRVIIANTNTSSTVTLKVNSLPAFTIINPNGNFPEIGQLPLGSIAEFIFDGVHFQLLSASYQLTASQIQPANVSLDFGSVNAMVANLIIQPPVLTGTPVRVFVAHTNTSSTVTLKVNALSAFTVINPDGTPPGIGQIKSGGIAEFIFDGTHFQLLSASSPRAAVQPTQTVFLSGSGTYTVPVGVIRLAVRMVGGGGGGGGSGSTTTAGNGGNGTATAFGSVTANFGGGGGKGVTTVSGGGFVIGGLGGGVGTGGSGTASLRLTGAAGQLGGSAPTTSIGAFVGGGNGAGAPFFAGFGVGGTLYNQSAIAGVDAPANSGGGGGGAGAPTLGGFSSAGGGGPGEYVEINIGGPASSYSYSVGTGGTAGTAGTSGFPGGNGAAGQIIIFEYYG